MDNWDPAVTDPLAIGREVILFESAGIGRSSGTVPNTIAGMAKHALAFLDRLGIETCDVLGFSLGDMVAQQMVLAHGRPAMSASNVADARRPPFRLAGLPVPNWAYALRIWAAMMLALFASFWLQLDSASSSAVTVAILAQPRRGDALRKATFRFGATVIGVMASIVITALFSQSRDLFVVAFAAWMGLAVYVSKFYDGSRAYGAVLAGYTVSIITVFDVDAPQNVFLGGLARLAVVTVGIASIALVNDVLLAPTVYPGLRSRLFEVHERTVTMVRLLIRGEAWKPRDVVDLFAALTATRLDIHAVSAEGAEGSNRSAAAASAVVAMVDCINKARALAIFTRELSGAEPQVWREAIEAEDRTTLESAIEAALSAETRSPDRVTCLVVASNLVASLRVAADELAAMEAGRPPSRHVAMPIHRDREAARLAGLRVFLGILVSAILFIQSSWPTTSLSLGLMGVLGGLSATTPSPQAFGKGALIAFPIAFVVAGITEYGILDGADAFPLLMIGMAPSVFGACLLFLNPKTSALGFLLLVFVLIFFAPSNPQDYSEETFLYGGTLVMGGGFLFTILTMVFIPVSDRDRRRWMVNRARTNLLQAMDQRAPHAPEEMAYLTADRIVALSGFKIGTEPARLWRLRYTLLLSNLTLVVGRGHAELGTLARFGTDHRMIASAHGAFARLDVQALHTSADALLRQSFDGVAAVQRVAAAAIADLTLAAVLVQDNRSTLRHLHYVLTP